jgi:hypothetical protein
VDEKRERRRKDEQLRASRYFLFAFGACPPCGLVAVVFATFALDNVAGDSLVAFDLLVLAGVPAVLASIVGNRAKLTSQQIVAASIGAAGLAFVEAFAIVLIAISHANFVNPAL